MTPLSGETSRAPSPAAEDMSRLREVAFLGTICMAQLCTRESEKDSPVLGPEANTQQRRDWDRHCPSYTGLAILTTWVITRS